MTISASKPSRLIVVAGLFGALAVAGCGRGGESDEVAPADVQSGQAPAGAAAGDEPEAPAATTAAGFVTRAALNDLYEIESSRLALQRSQSPEVKAFAQRMVDDHTRMSNEMKAAVALAGLNAGAPAALDAERTEHMRELREASASDFDDRYLDQQKEAHENARNLLRDFSNNGDDERLKGLAARALPIIENHLQMAERLGESRAEDPAGAAASPPR